MDRPPWPPPRPPPGPPHDDWLRRSLAGASREERDALRIWSTGRHHDIQAVLHGRLAPTAELDMIIRQIDRALASDPLPHPARLLRITRRDKFPAGPLGSLIGRQQIERGYIAATINIEPPRMPVGDPVLMRITAARETPAAYLASVSTVPSQREVLLARGLRVLITDVQYDPVVGRWVVDATIGSP